MRVLVVDDEPDVVRLVEVALTMHGMSVTCWDGPLEPLLERPAWIGGGWDAVVLDLMMPEVHGLDILQAIRNMNLPVRVVVLTAGADRLMALAHQYGADVVLHKPFEISELVRVLASG